MSSAQTDYYPNDEIPSDAPVIEVLITFVDAPTWGEKSHILATNAPLLLSHHTRVLLLQAVHYLDGRNDVRGATYLEKHLHLLEAACKKGVVQAWRDFQRQSEQEITTRAIRFLGSSPEQRGSVFERGFQSVLDHLNQEQDLQPPDLNLEGSVLFSRPRCATPYVAVIDILEHHQELLEQFHAWNDAVIRWVLEGDIQFKNIEE